MMLRISVRSRPVTRMPGNTVPLDTLYPSAMLPFLSIAKELIQRFVESGLKVEFWTKVGGLAPGFWIPNQRPAEVCAPAPSGSVEMLKIRLQTPPRFL